MLGDGSQAPTSNPCNIIPQAIINPTNLLNANGQPEGIGQALVNLYPVADVQGVVGLNYALVPVRRLNEGTGDIRIDHNFSNKDSVFARASYDQANSFVPGGPRFRGAKSFREHAEHLESRAQRHDFRDACRLLPDDQPVQLWL